MTAPRKTWFFALMAWCYTMACTQAAITILTPAANTIWYKNNTVQTTWSSGVEDPNNFRIQMQQPNGENVTLADTVPTSLQALTLGLPQLANGNGYLIRFVNTSETSQIYAESQPFEVAQGISIASSGTTSASSTVAIPGPYTPFSVAPTSTGTATQATGHAIRRYNSGALFSLLGISAAIGLLYNSVG